ncbi:MAG: DCC1-like thiol-disulfide oxidoreductase family protein [Polymorphobacter sp.]|uniref:DCC1-like thiol-disulfide oxidoreductase family protein n=1 Tax=Polymorphobacter sp. TaxID=1909290 RepID=UPI003A8C6225
MSLAIHYDGDCPFCARYVAMVRLREAAGPVRLANLRDHPDARARFEALGLDLDEGMIVETGGRLYHGAEAVHVISLMSSRSGVLNRIAATLLGVEWLARLLYPLLRAGRNAALFFMGRKGFRVDDVGERAALDMFTRMLGLYSVLDVYIYVFDYKPLVFIPTTVPLLLLGLAVFLAPRWRPGLVLLILVAALDSWLHAPVGSNHSIIRAMLSLAFLAAGLWQWLAGSAFTRFFADVRPIGRALLLTMYVFGIFHKINTDFLDPAVSCAVVLWQQMPAPLAALDGPLMRTLAIYGTFAAEGAVLVMLLVPRWRGLGIVLGISFHALLALSDYQLYATFSMLAVVLHLLFISPAAAKRITESAAWQIYARMLARPLGIIAVVLLLAIMALAAAQGRNSVVGLLWLALVALPVYAIARHGAADEGAAEPLLWSRLAPLKSHQPALLPQLPVALCRAQDRADHCHVLQSACRGRTQQPSAAQPCAGAVRQSGRGHHPALGARPSAAGVHRRGGARRAGAEAFLQPARRISRCGGELPGAGRGPWSDARG